MTVDLLRAVGALQAVALVILAAVLFGHVTWSVVAERRRQPRVEAATTALAHLLAGGGTLERAVEATRALPTRVQLDLLGGLAASVHGEQRDLVTAVARLTGLVDRAQRWCASRRRTTRLRGVRLLGRVGAAPRSVPALLADPWAAVRAETTALVATHPAPAAVARLLDLLDDPAPVVAFAAKDALVRCGAAATEGVTRRLAGVSAPPATTAAILDVAVRVAHPSLAPLAERHRTDPDPDVRAAAATLAAAVGSSTGAGMLGALLEDPDARVRAAAATGLGHIGHWPAAARLASLLSDRAWVVRRAAGLALRRLGAPGTLYLRRSLDAPDAFARDMARQVLDLPDLRAAG